MPLYPEFGRWARPLWPLALVALALPALTLMVRSLPARVAQPHTVSQESTVNTPCGELSALISDRSPLVTGPQVWGFARMAGMQLRACRPGLLTFTAYRKKVRNTPSRWEVYLDDTLIRTGKVGNDVTAVQVRVAAAGTVSIIFSNAFASPDDVVNRRTLYLRDVGFRGND